MTAPTALPAPFAMSRIAGLLYVAIAVFGMFSIGYVPSQVFIFGDAAANAQSVLAHQGLFRIGIFADMLTILCEVAVTAILYTLLKPVNATVALMATLARFGMVVIMVINLVAYMAMLDLLNDGGALAAIAIDQRQALAMLFLQVHEFGVYGWQILFGAHLVALGYLVARSGYFPRILGTLMMIGSFGYTLQSVEKFVLPGNQVLWMLVVGLLTIVTLAEVGFALWLLIKGLNATGWTARQRVTAA
ncbi:MAG TPA: DUF4386 domain-containing protein [Devosiaceae bacterium]